MRGGPLLAARLSVQIFADTACTDTIAGITVDTPIGGLGHTFAGAAGAIGNAGCALTRLYRLLPPGRLTGTPARLPSPV